jgi:uncharacterized membrane protein
MSWYELLLFLHILAIATWFGSGVAITVLGARSLKTDDAVFGPFTINAGWWASRAHPTAGVVLLLTGFAMVADADLSLGDTWLWLALVGWVVTLGVGGALIGRTSGELTERIEANGGVLAPEHRALGEQLLLYARIELVLLVLIIADMVAKPGL